MTTRGLLKKVLEHQLVDRESKLYFSVLQKSIAGRARWLLLFGGGGFELIALHEHNCVIIPIPLDSAGNPLVWGKTSRHHIPSYSQTIWESK